MFVEQKILVGNILISSSVSVLFNISTFRSFKVPFFMLSFCDSYNYKPRWK